MSRVFNFCAGPATLPEEVLQEAQAEFMDYQGSGMSILESSHRGKEYSAVHDEAVANYTELLGLTDDYSVIFVPGGATTQFALIPMNLMAGKTADYVNSGSWATKAIKEAQCVGDVNVVADCAKDLPCRMPKDDELSLSDDAAYLHLTSNETISGAQYKDFPTVDAPLVADMSSDILSRPLDITKFGLIYAGAQKNIGPSGIAIVIIRKDLAERAPTNIPTMLQYRTHINNNSLYNTPATFSIYLMMLVSRWLKKHGLDNVYETNVRKAGVLYNVIDEDDFYSGTAHVDYRSDMNVTFRLPTEELEAKLISEADAAGFKGLKGHRSVGGLRASIYNAMPEAGVSALADFMKEFRTNNG